MYASKYTNELKPWEKFTQAAVYYLILLLLRVHLLYICSYSSSAAGIIFLLCIWVDLHLSAVDFTANKSYQEAERWSIKRLLSSWTELTNESQLETAVDPLGVQTRVKLSEWVSCFFFFFFSSETQQITSTVRTETNRSALEFQPLIYTFQYRSQDSNEKHQI